MVLHRKYVPYAMLSLSPDGLPGYMVPCEGSLKLPLSENYR